MTVLAFVPDLMDRSKVAAAVPGAVVVRRAADLLDGAGPATTAIVDLSRPGVAEVLPALVAAGARVVAFGSHVDGATLDAARAAGCAVVLARSAFFSRIAEVVG